MFGFISPVRGPQGGVCYIYVGSKRWGWMGVLVFLAVVGIYEQRIQFVLF